MVFTKNPLQLFHDMLLDADIITASDYGMGEWILPATSSHAF